MRFLLLLLAKGRWRPTIELREGGAHAPLAREAGPFRHASYGKIGGIEKAFGALDAKRLGHLDWRGIKMLSEQPRQVAWANA